MAITDIQGDCFAHLHIRRSPETGSLSTQFYYPFEFKAASMSACIQTLNSDHQNGLTLHKISSSDPSNLHYMEVGIRNQNAYVPEK